MEERDLEPHVIKLALISWRLCDSSFQWFW